MPAKDKTIAVAEFHRAADEAKTRIFHARKTVQFLEKELEKAQAEEKRQWHEISLEIAELMNRLFLNRRVKISYLPNSGVGKRVVVAGRIVGVNLKNAAQERHTILYFDGFRDEFRDHNGEKRFFSGDFEWMRLFEFDFEKDGKHFDQIRFSDAVQILEVL